MADTSYLGWPFFEERHRRRAAELERFAANELTGLAGHAQDDDSLDATCREIVRRLGRAGLLEACCVTARADAFDVRSLCLSREILARHEGLADFAFAMQGLGTGPISLFGSAAQRQAYLPPVTRGERIAAFALSEPQAGSDVGAIATTARRDGNAYVINGTKTWISNGGIADHYVVFARTGPESGSKGLSAFVVDAGVPGFTVAARIRTISPHPLATLAFDDCRVPAEALLGAEGEG
ncbi:MAG: acyl-CoA dehydrogenase family protein, partial [Burkholderiales bacterium]